MVGHHIRVRNLTSVDLRIIHLERFEAAQATSGRGVLWNFTSFAWKNSSSGPSSLDLGQRAQSFFHQELDIVVHPFCIKDTGIASPSDQVERKDNEIARLTFLIGSQKYRLTLPSDGKESTALECLDSSAKRHLTAINVEKERQFVVGICESTELNCWMRNLLDQTPLSALSIPGTHNSPTCYYALPSVRCQVVGPAAQLENGVRFFDIRVQPAGIGSEKLILVHSAFPVSLTGTKYFHDFLTEVYEFLERHPSETIIMSVKREGTGSSTDEDLASILHHHYTGAECSAKHWYVQPTIPSLGAVRGKIVLLRRFRASNTPWANASGINAETWADNTAYDQGKFVCVQDFYEVMETLNISSKVQYIEEQMARAAECVALVPGVNTDKKYPLPPQPFYLNFLSASNFWRVGCWPDRIAKKVNPSVLEYLVTSHAVEGGQQLGTKNSSHGTKKHDRRRPHTSGDGSTGIVVCDWVGEAGNWDLVRCIVAMNCKLMIHETGQKAA